MSTRAQPVREQLAAARLLTAGLETPRAAWERLAEKGLIPGEWLRDPKRRFEGTVPAPCPACRGSGRGLADLPCMAPGCFHGQIEVYRTEDRPSTVDLAVALAADVPGVLHAEEIARELAERLLAFGAAEIHYVSWRLARKAIDERDWLERCPTALEPVFVALEGDVAERARKHPDQWLDLGAEAWAASKNPSFTAKSSPFAPLLALRETGYALAGVGTAVTLVAPRLPR